MVPNILKCPLRLIIEKLLLFNDHGFEERITPLTLCVVNRKWRTLAWIHRFHCMLQQRNA